MRASEGEKAVPYTFRSTGSVMKFDGFIRVYTEGKDTEEVADDEQPPLPPLATGQQLDLIKLDPRQHFTEPPPRYTEATIVKKMEDVDIGRPSTWASFIQVIRERKYVELREKRFYPTELGFTVSDQLVKHFPSIMDVQFTAEMDHKLDDVAQGSVDWITLLRAFYDPFELQLEAAKTEMENLKPQPVVTEICCPDTGKPMLLRQGRFGAFLGCSGFPECKKILKLDADGAPVDGLNFTCGLLPQGAKETVDPASLPNATDHVCPNGVGRMLVRASRYGPFLGCSEYPKCRSTLKITTGGELLPDQEFVCTYKEGAKGSGRKTGSTARTGVRKSAATAAKAPSAKKSVGTGKAAPKRKPAAAKTTAKE
jgi:DNA topoisomerase-1